MSKLTDQELAYLKRIYEGRAGSWSAVETDRLIVRLIHEVEQAREASAMPRSVSSAHHAAPGTAALPGKVGKDWR